MPPAQWSQAANAFHWSPNPQIGRVVARAPASTFQAVPCPTNDGFRVRGCSCRSTRSHSACKISFGHCTVSTAAWHKLCIVLSDICLLLCLPLLL